MKLIQKKISLEQFKSRMPSVIPSYYDNGKENYYVFNGKTNFNEEGERIPYVNYGLVPFSDIWDRGKYNGGLVSYNTIASWFHFLEFYMKLLQKHGCLTDNYRSAIDYSTYEVNHDYTDDDYAAFDEKIREICGEGDNLYELAKNTYNFMLNKYFPRFEIDESLQRYWNRKYLSVSDANYWITWFESVKNELNGITDVKDCPNANDCCDCEKFFQFGGEDMLNKLKEFLNSLPKSDVGEYEEPFFTIKIQLTRSIDDLGEYSIFYEEWEGGIDYSYYNQENKSLSGAVVSHNEQDWILTKRDSGYLYSDMFKEYYFGTKSGMTIDERMLYEDNSNMRGDENQFSRLIEHNAIIDDNGEKSIKFEFNGGVIEGQRYAYDYNGQKVTFAEISEKDDFKPSDDEFKLMYANYDVTEKDVYYIKGIICEVVDVDYVKIGDYCYKVTYDTYGNPITKVHGINFYANFDAESDDYKFTINNESYTITKDAKGIFYKGKLFVEDADKIKVGSKTYNKIKKYCTINGNVVLLNDDNKTISQVYNDANAEYELIESETVLGKNVSLSELTNETYDSYFVDNNKLYLVHPFAIYKANEITGHTESKITSFMTTTNVIHDNIGNKLFGTYHLDENEMPISLKDRDLIGLLYKPNTTIHLSAIVDDDGNAIENQYWGDYLESIELYYTDVNDNKLTSVLILGVDGNLLEIMDKLKGDDELNGRDGTLKARFVYYMGCSMEIINAQVTILDEGVKYVDVIELEEKQCKYFLNDYTCYILKYYDFKTDKINYKNEDYNFNSQVIKSAFTCKITDFLQKDNEGNDIFKCNGWVDFPIVREEYKLGSSSLANVDADVYIDRGTSRAFDQHLKLLEVNSLESLEQYGNGFFNIITN